MDNHQMASETKPTPSEIERAREIATNYPRMHEDDLVKEISQALAEAREQERERCAMRAKNERLVDNVDDDSDRAYNRAVRDCVAAIRRGEP